MKDFLLYLVASIVDEPKKVAVSELTSPEGYLVLEIAVAPLDMGKIIGKGGRIIRAVRDLVRVLAIKQNTRVNVAVKEV